MTTTISNYETPKEDIVNPDVPIDGQVCEKLINKLDNENNINCLNIIKYIYKNKNFFHEYLKEKEIIINLKFDDNNINVAFLFYLCLLITDKPNFINYSYQMDAIKHIDDLHITNENRIIKIIISKIIIVLIHNYEGFEDFDEYNEKEIMRIKKDNIDIIRENIRCLNNIGLKWNENDLYEKKFDEIYIDIIIALFKNNTFEDNEKMYQLLEHLDCISIDMTEIMNEKLSDYLNDKNNNLLIDKNNLIDEKKINFYYFILYYILKEPSAIFQFPFFVTTKKILKDLNEKDKNRITISHLDKGFQMRFKYILKILLGDEYYEQKGENIFGFPEKNINFESTKNGKADEEENQYENEKSFSNSEKNKSKESLIIIEIDKKIVEDMIKNSSYDYIKIEEYIYQTSWKYQYENMDLIFNIKFDFRTKEIKNIINANDISNPILFK